MTTVLAKDTGTGFIEGLLGESTLEPLVKDCLNALQKQQQEVSRGYFFNPLS